MRLSADTHVHVTANRAGDNTRLFVVRSPPKKHPRTSPVTVDANSGRFLIGAAQKTHVKWTKKCLCGCGGAAVAAMAVVGASVVRHLNWW